jgi:hypothetical protein
MVDALTDPEHCDALCLTPTSVLVEIMAPSVPPEQDV